MTIFPVKHIKVVQAIKQMCQVLTVLERVIEKNKQTLWKKSYEDDGQKENIEKTNVVR